MGMKLTLLFLCGGSLCLQLAIRFTNRKYHEEIMAQLDDLNSALDSISTEIDKVSTDTTSLLAELKALEGQTAPDLSGVIAKAQAIQAKLTAVDELFPESPAPAPAPEPAS
jgi:uncharacterized membrane-anchored protein YhcB (DUF1043 family)